MQAVALPSVLAAVQAKAWPAFRAHIWLLLAVAAYGALMQMTAVAMGATANLSLSLYSKVFGLGIPVFATVAILGRVVYVMVAVRPKHLTRHLLADMRQYLAPERFLAALPIFLALPVFASMFTSFKAMIPLVQPFAWDPDFAAWDQALHFGYQPWELLQPILGHPYATTAINVVYNCWFLVMYGIWMWQAFTTKNPMLRMRFFLSFVVSWAVLGTGAAMLLSSAGPCYFGAVTGLPDPYLGLMDYLREASLHAPIWAVETQEMLWQDSLRPGIQLGSGISAMPSMHVATSVLFALLGWQVGRRLGIALTVFAALIMLGSVHLGWHYAIDGYVGAAGAVAVWWAVGWFLRRDRFFQPAGAAATVPA